MRDRLASEWVVVYFSPLDQPTPPTVANDVQSRHATALSERYTI